MRRYSAKVTCNFKEPTNRSHPMMVCVYMCVLEICVHMCAYVYINMLCICVEQMCVCA